MKNDNKNYENDFNYEYNDDAPISMGTMAKLFSPFIAWGLIVFTAVALKTSGVVAWEWLWVTSTLWIPAALVLVSATVAVAYEVTRRTIDAVAYHREEKRRLKQAQKVENWMLQAEENKCLVFKRSIQENKEYSISEQINTLFSEKESLLNNAVEEEEDIKIYKRD